MHTHSLKQIMTKKKKWLQQNPGKGPNPSSQAACQLVIARGIGSPLKRLRVCVHVFKRQCHVSACHLWATTCSTLPLSLISSSLSHGWKSTVEGAQWLRPAWFLCLTVGVWSHCKKKLRLIINISLTYNAQQALKEPAGRGKLTPMGGEASITSLWLLPLQSMTSIQYMAHYQVFGLHITTILKTKMKQAFEILLKTSLTLPFNCSVQLCYFLDLWLGNWS